MGIFHTVMQAVEQHPDLSQEQHSSLVQSAVEMLGDGSSISGILHNAESQGIGHIVQSWIGSGSNQPVAPQQVQGLLGPERINEIANRVGIPAGVACAALSRILPVIVDRFTPQGKLPQAA